MKFRMRLTGFVGCLFAAAVLHALEDPFKNFPRNQPPKFGPDVLDMSDKTLDQPRPVKQVTPIYPYVMRRAGIGGEVEVGFIVDTEGAVHNAYVIWSNNPWFERPALDAVSKWKFEPGRVNGRPVNVRMTVPIAFEITGSPGTDLWTVAQKSKNHDKLPPEFQWDTPPRPVGTTYPIYPFELLRDGVKTKIQCALIVDPRGRVARVDFPKPSPPPAFAQSIRAMFDAWRFKPAKKDGQPCFALLSREEDFHPRGTGTVPVTESALHILKELKRKEPRIVPLGELDEVPRPIGRRRPVYPEALSAKGIEGEAVIEFFIDKEGDAQLPRIVSSTEEEFGHAAAQAVSTWRFEPPRKNGKPVIARAQVPVVFSIKDPPAEDE